MLRKIMMAHGFMWGLKTPHDSVRVTFDKLYAERYQTLACDFALLMDYYSVGAEE